MKSLKIPEYNNLKGYSNPFNQKTEIRDRGPYPSRARYTNCRHKSRIPFYLLVVTCLSVFGYLLLATGRNNHQVRSSELGGRARGVVMTHEGTKLNNVIKDDWLVNDDTVGGCTQLKPSITHTKTGYIGVWVDYRNGHDPDIYACRFNFSGLPIGTTVRVNADSGGSYQYSPSVDADSAGNFVVVWEDKRNVGTDIYCQRYDNNAVPIGTNFRVNDDASGREQYTPVVSVCPGGEFIVAWRDDRGSGPDIYAQVYDATGSPIGSNFVVNDDALPNPFQVFPAISKTPNNEFAVIWLDTRAGIGIYCQRYSCSGTPIGSNFEITDNSDSTAPMRYSAINSNLLNRTVVVWQDHREHDGYPNIYAQLYDSLWNKVGANFRVNDDTIFAWHDVPSVAVDHMGNFVVVWNDKRSNFSAPDVYGQRYNAMGNPEDTNFKINELSPGTQDFTNPVVDVDTLGNFLVVWQDNSSIDRELLAQIYNQSGTPVDSNFPLIQDEGMSNQQAPEIAMNTSGNFVIVWEDARTNKMSIFAQRYNADGNALGVNWKVNNTNESANSASVAIDSGGNFVVVWVYKKTLFHNHIYGCKYTSAGIPVTAEFKVDSGPDVKRWTPSVCMDEMGNFVVVWEDYRNDTKYGDIYGQRYSADCTPVGSNFRISNIPGESSESPSVTMNEDGTFVVVWQEGKAGLPFFDIYGQRFNSSGDTVGGNFQISDAPMIQHQQIHPSVAMHRDGNFIVVWQDSREHTDEIYDIYAQIYDANGLPVDTNFKVNKTVDSASHEEPSVVFHPWTKDFMVVWTGYQEINPQIMAQKFDSLGTPLGNNFQINNPGVHPCDYHLSSSRSVGTNGERVAFVWTDNRRLKGWDIYAKLVKWEFGKVEEGVINRLLLQVFPNPAIKYLTIKYTNYLPSSIQLYDCTGRRVTEFTLPKTRPGIYTIDVSTFSSGIYFLKFNPYPANGAAPTITQKVIICH